MHKHCAGPIGFAGIEWNMMIESGTGELPPYTVLIRKTHTRKDGTIIDHRAAELIADVEGVATQLSQAEVAVNSDDETEPSAVPTTKFPLQFVKHILLIWSFNLRKDIFME